MKRSHLRISQHHQLIVQSMSQHLQARRMHEAKRADDRWAKRNGKMAGSSSTLLAVVVKPARLRRDRFGEPSDHHFVGDRVPFALGVAAFTLRVVRECPSR